MTLKHRIRKALFAFFKEEILEATRPVKETTGIPWSSIWAAIERERRSQRKYSNLL